MAEQAEITLTESNAGDFHNLGLKITDLAACKLRLFTSGFHPNPGNIAADFVAAEATFTGYTPLGYVLTWSAAALGADDNAVSQSSRMFTQITALPAQTIGGAWIETAAGVLLYYAEFLAPIALAAVLNYIAITVHLRERGPVQMDVEY